MSWLETTKTTKAGDDDGWLEDDEDTTHKSLDPIDSLRLKFETLGQNAGLQMGMGIGERKGFDDGFRSEATRAFALGRMLGAAKTVLAVKGDVNNVKSLEDAIARAEQVARESWVSQPPLVDDALACVRKELLSLGLDLPEWPEQSKEAPEERV